MRLPLFLFVMLLTTYGLFSCAYQPLSEAEKFVLEQRRINEIVMCKQTPGCFLVCERPPVGKLDELRDCQPATGVRQ